jgi:hypothetical protein
MGGGVQAASRRHVTIQISRMIRKRNAKVGPPKRGNGITAWSNA